MNYICERDITFLFSDCYIIIQSVFYRSNADFQNKFHYIIFNRFHFIRYIEFIVNSWFIKWSVMVWRFRQRTKCSAHMTTSTVEGRSVLYLQEFILLLSDPVKVYETILLVSVSNLCRIKYIIWEFRYSEYYVYVDEEFLHKKDLEHRLTLNVITWNIWSYSVKLGL